MIKVILCDLDGTLIDSEKHYMKYTVELMKELGFNKDVEDIYRIIGTTMEDTYKILEECLDYQVPKEKIIERNEYYFDCYKPLDFTQAIFPKVKETLMAFKQMGIQLALCSSSSLDILEDFIEKTDLQGIFNFIESSESIQNPKPHPDTYLNALNHFQVNKEEAIVYEDSKIGIQAGVAAGIFTVARQETNFHFDQTEADLIVKNIEELYQYVWRINHEGKNCN